MEQGTVFAYPVSGCGCALCVSTGSVNGEKCTQCNGTGRIGGRPAYVLAASPLPEDKGRPDIAELGSDGESEIAVLRRERDEAREAVAWVNNSFGSWGYHLNPHPAEQVEKVKKYGREQYARAEAAEQALAASRAEVEHWKRKAGAMEP